MSVRWVVVLVIVVLAAVLVMILRGTRYEHPIPPLAPPEVEHTRWVDLYFPSVQGGLAVEAREVRAEPSSNREARAILRELFRGPLMPGALPLLEVDARVESFFLDAQGTAYVGLDSVLVRDPPGGTSCEVVCLEAIMRTVLSNVRGAKRIQLMVDGQVPRTLWGHLRLDRPVVGAAVGDWGGVHP